MKRMDIWIGIFLLMTFFGTSTSQHLLNLTALNKFIPDLSKWSNPQAMGENLVDWMAQFTDRCDKNGVRIDAMDLLVKAYGCLESPDKEETALEILASIMGGKGRSIPTFAKICQHWPSTMKCLHPILSTLEKCLSSEDFPLDGVMTEGITLFAKPICTNDKYYAKALEKDGPATLNCMATHADVLIMDIVECFDARSLKAQGETDGSKAICSDFETYKDCFIDALEICNSPGVEKLVYRLLEQRGFEKIVYKYLLKCD